MRRHFLFVFERGLELPMTGKYALRIEIPRSRGRKL
jgi:hypothetical protein